MSSPRISIALTTYNHEAFIARALDSILEQQQAPDFEIVVGEDGSTDGTRHIVQRYMDRHAGRIRLLPAGQNLGYVKNFDRTLKACTGDYIAIFDGDDIMLPGKLHRQAAFLDKHPEFVMCGHDVRAFDDETGKTLRMIAPPVHKTFYTIEDLIIHGSFFANCSKMFRRAAFPPEGIDHRIKVIADWYITLMIVDKGKIGYLHELLAEYRVHPASIMQTLKGKQDFSDKMFILDKLDQKYPGKYQRLFRNQMAYAYLIYGIDELNNGHIASARSKFAKSILRKFNYTRGQYFYLASTLLPRFIRNELLKRLKPKR
jgi:glycosyltransferase involved in cell wall biosynthesis